ncbi:hypothetical protein [Alteribacter keqinensis]|uniref:Uncharacterized protein n=1 Tax=Alteribacter keqinensis TaxID=2483800 RepID=A0A3M7TMN0_9BACI|nr:hypothetical protein [Alteribacter keqinensis]RNA66893.1 hypothetical protein EBO34_16965 [Alteribacter keqinensis]
MRRKHENEFRGFAVYIVLFIMVAVVNTILFVLNEENVQAAVAGVAYTFFLYISLKRKIWAVYIIKLMVWIHIIVLMIIVVVVVLT